MCRDVIVEKAEARPFRGVKSLRSSRWPPLWKTQAAFQLADFLLESIDASLFDPQSWS